VRIFTRAEWGARHPQPGTRAPLPAREVWLHHAVIAGGGVTATFDTDCAAMRLVEQIGQSRFGQGISYTWGVSESGRVFEGHGIDRRGAHTGGRNSIARAICLLGNYQQQNPTPAQLSAVAELLAYGHAAGWWAAPRLAGGHRDAPGASTACPGDRAWAHIPAINSAASGVRPPTVARPPADQDGDDELDAEQARKLDVIYAELTKKLPNRRGPQGKAIEGGGADTVLGYAANADGSGFRAEWSLASLASVLTQLANGQHATNLALGQTNERIAALAARPSGPGGIDLDALAERVADVMARRMES
jgi:N-acetylmuramoyl-L-alanine amidase